MFHNFDGKTWEMFVRFHEYGLSAFSESNDSRAETHTRKRWSKRGNQVKHV
jgi:hypothetical protein